MTTTGRPVGHNPDDLSSSREKPKTARRAGVLRMEAIMAGVVLQSGGGARRPLDSELNMVPMIDLLMVTVSFLLVTAVWSQMARVEGSTQAPGRPEECPDCTPPAPRALHVDMRRGDRFVLSWRSGHTILSTVDVPRRPDNAEGAAGGDLRFPELADAVTREWRANGSHAASTDTTRDEAVLHAADDSSYADMIGAMDAVYVTQRDVRGVRTAAFAVTLAAQ